MYSIPYGPLRGTKIWYDRGVNYHAVLGLWEPDTVQMLATVVGFVQETRPQIAACDVGANIGLVTMWLSQLQRNNGRVYSFEPSPSVRISTNIQKLFA